MAGDGSKEAKRPTLTCLAENYRPKLSSARCHAIHSRWIYGAGNEKRKEKYIYKQKNTTGLNEKQNKQQRWQKRPAKDWKEVPVVERRRAGFYCPAVAQQTIRSRRITDVIQSIDPGRRLHDDSRSFQHARLTCNCIDTVDFITRNNCNRRFTTKSRCNQNIKHNTTLVAISAIIIKEQL